jgi:hypothetical protein
MSAMAPSSREAPTHNSGAGQINIRGYNIQSYLRNGFRTELSDSGSLQGLANGESVEVLKGASTILYGLVEPGGMINIVELHRAGGRWLWPLLAVFAWSAVAFNLDGVLVGATKLAFDFGETEWAEQDEASADRPIIGWREAELVASRLMQEQARLHDFTIVRPESLTISRAEGWCGYTVTSIRDPGDKYRATRIDFDARGGALLALEIPTGRSVGETIATWVAQINMANVFGLPFRLLVLALGGVIAVLSVTGVVWWKKRAARLPPLRRRGTPCAQVVRARVENAVAATGVVQAIRHVDIGTRVSGQIKSLRVKIGDQVSDGQLLAEIDPVPFALPLDRSQIRADGRRSRRRREHRRHARATAPRQGFLHRELRGAGARAARSRIR